MMEDRKKENKTDDNKKEVTYWKRRKSDGDKIKKRGD